MGRRIFDFNETNPKKKYSKIIVKILALAVIVIIFFAISRLVTYDAGCITKKEPLDIKNNYEIADLYYYVGEHSFKSYFDCHKKLDRTNPKHIWQFSNSRKAKKKVYSSLKKKGYKVRVKQIASIYDNTAGEYRLKCNADVELTIDAIDRMDDYEIFILISGDADFVKLVQYLKEKRKKTVQLRIRNQPSAQCKVGSEDMDNEAIASNIQTVISRIERKFEKGLRNIRGMYIKTTMGSPIKLEL